MNGLIGAGTSARRIEGLSGIPHSQADRHKRHCFIRLKAEEIKKRNHGFDRRYVTEWPDGKLTLQAEANGIHTGEEISPSDSDLIFKIITDATPTTFKNPRIHSLQLARELAELENVERDASNFSSVD